MKIDFASSVNGNEYGTPQWLFDYLNREFNFTFDLACSDINIKTAKGFTQSHNSLAQDWHKLEGWLWLNPPYSPLKPWIKKAQEENAKGAKIVVLCPPIISTRYFQEHLPSEVRFIVGRVGFVYEGREIKGNNMDSSLLIYDTKVRQPRISYVERDSMSKFASEVFS